MHTDECQLSGRLLIYVLGTDARRCTLRPRLTRRAIALTPGYPGYRLSSAAYRRSPIPISAHALALTQTVSLKPPADMAQHRGAIAQAGLLPVERALCKTKTTRVRHMIAGSVVPVPTIPLDTLLYLTT
jgi:hypothetical protein